MRIPMPWDIVVDLTRGYILREVSIWVLLVSCIVDKDIYSLYVL